MHIGILSSSLAPRVIIYNIMHDQVFLVSILVLLTTTQSLNFPLRNEEMKTFCSILNHGAGRVKVSKLKESSVTKAKNYGIVLSWESDLKGENGKVAI